MLVRIAAFAINTQWQVLWWGDHLSTWEPTYMHTYTQTHKHIYTNTGAQVFLGLAYTLAMCHASGCLPCQQHTTHTKRSTKAHTHTAWRQGKSAHEPMHANLTHSDTIIPWPWMPKWVQRSGTRVCVCVLICMCVYACVFAACWQMICLKLTPPTLSQWQQVSSQGPDLCELRWYTVG